MTTPTTSKEFFKLLLMMIYHPLGMTKFMLMLNDDLQLGPIQSKMNHTLGVIVDILRCLAFVFLLVAIYVKIMGG